QSSDCLLPWKYRECEVRPDSLPLLPVQLHHRYRDRSRSIRLFYSLSLPPLYDFKISSNRLQNASWSTPSATFVFGSLLVTDKVSTTVIPYDCSPFVSIVTFK